jgi:hypothetical protein
MLHCKHRAHWREAGDERLRDRPRGFAAVDDPNIAVCLLPGTELALSADISYSDWSLRSLIREWRAVRTKTTHRTAIFRQVNVGQITHHDALELPDGKTVLLTHLSQGQEATVLQLPAVPRRPVETQKQEPAAIPA